MRVKKHLAWLLLGIASVTFLISVYSSQKSARGDTENIFKSLLKEITTNWDKISNVLKMDFFSKKKGAIAPVLKISTVMHHPTNYINQLEKLIRNTRLANINAQKPSDYNNNYTDVIGIACNGAGVTGMISTLGYLRGLEENDLLPLSCYIAGSSASTWAIAGWYIYALEHNVYTIGQYIDVLLYAYHHNRSPLEDENGITRNNRKARAFLEACIWPKILLGQPLTFLDFAAGLVHDLTLMPPQGTFSTYPFSAIKAVTQQGLVPFPLFTALGIIPNRGIPISQHYELTPLEIKNIDTGHSFETYGLSRSFMQGISQEKQSKNEIPLPEFSVDSINTICAASAISEQAVRKILFKDKSVEQFIENVYKSTRTTVQKGLSFLKKIAAIIKKDEVSSIVETFDQHSSTIKPSLYIAATQKNFIPSPLTLPSSETIRGGLIRSYVTIPNPLYLASNAPSGVKEERIMHLTDASYAYDVPLLPLFNTKRELDCIIFCDANQDVQDFNRALEDIKKRYSTHYMLETNEKTCKIYKPQRMPMVEQTAPWIIYLSLENAQSPTAFLLDKTNTMQLLEAGKATINKHASLIKATLLKRSQLRFHQILEGFGS